MLEAVGAGTAKQMGGDKDWADRWLDSEEHQNNIKEIGLLKALDPATMSDEPNQTEPVRATSCEFVFS